LVDIAKAEMLLIVGFYWNAACRWPPAMQLARRLSILRPVGANHRACREWS